MAEKQYKEGWFKPRYPEKYLGDATKIYFRSSYELRAFQWLDGNPNVLNWASEEIAIPYAKPVHPTEDPRGWRKANYFPDLLVIFQKPDGKIYKELIEIKPKKQTKVSRARKAKTKLMEDYAYAVNQAKWAAAIQWCKPRGIEFRIITEESLWRM
jgi:hypothetical protein